MRFPRFSRQGMKTELLLWLALLVLFVVFSVAGFWVSDLTHRPLQAVNKAIGLLVFNYPEDDNVWLDGAKFFAILVTFYGVVLVFFRKGLNRLAAGLIQRRPYELWILSGNSSLMVAEPGAGPLLRLAADEGEVDGQALYGRGVALLAGPAEQRLEGLALDRCHRALVATGSDRRNMALASRLAPDMMGDDLVIQVEVGNRDLAVLFQQQVLCAGGTADIVTFSRHEQTCKRLFSAHSVTGLQHELLDSSEDFHMVLIGTGELCVELVYHIALLAHLPRQNILTLHCLDVEAAAFCRQLEKRFPGIGKIPHLHIEPHQMDARDLDFYTDAVWRLPRLTHVFIATPDADVNLDIAVNLQDTTYISETAGGDFRSLVLFALDRQDGLGSAIDRDQGVFANFYSIAEPDDPVEWLRADESLDAIARMIHLDYELSGEPHRRLDAEAPRRAWLRASIHERDSCRSQAAHIDVKLLSLGLGRKRSDLPLDVLLQNNENRFRDALGEHDMSDEKLADYRPEYFPRSFDTRLDQLARAEHDRWNAFHYLRGWRYDPKKNKAAKRHDCLLPLEEFSTDAQRQSYCYDLLSVLRIPLYLAHAGYEIYPSR